MEAAWIYLGTLEDRRTKIWQWHAMHNVQVAPAGRRTGLEIGRTLAEARARK